MATIVRYASTYVESQTRSSGPRMLVLTDLYYPGWQALVDGSPAPIYRADYAFRGVPVGGTHVVEFRYCPLSFLAGAMLSGLTLLGLAGWWGWTAWAKRTAPASQKIP